MIEIENSNYNSRMYKAIKQLKIDNRHIRTPPPYTQQDLTKFYKEKFIKELITTKSSLENPPTTSIKVNITNKEVIDAINKLRTTSHQVIVNW